MVRRGSCACLCALGIVAFGFEGKARAEEPSVTAVEVTAAAAVLDADKLREQIGIELHTSIVPLGDPRAASARGTLTIDLERKSGQLSVTYLARTSPITRRVTLPTDSALARRAAVALAGNLARNEAPDLAAELRKEHAPVTHATAPPAEPVRNLDTDPRVDQVSETREARDVARLQATLEYHAREDRRSRVAVGWASLGGGIVAIGASAYVGVQTKDPLWVIAGSESLVLAAFGSILLVSTSPLEDLAVYSRRTDVSLSDTEQTWLVAAQRERHYRHLGGAFSLVASGVLLGLGTYSLLRNQTSDNPANGERFVPGLVFLGTGVFEGIAAAHAFAADGPVENALHAYERTSGRILDPGDTNLPRLQLSITPAGFWGAVSGTF